MRKIINVLLLSLISIVPSGARSETPSEVADISFSSDSRTEVTVGSYTVYYVLNRQTSINNPRAYSNSFVERSVQSATSDLFSFLRILDIPIFECQKDLEIGIYYISSESLNDRSRFRDWGPRNGLNSREGFELWALYNPMISNPKHTAIFLTDHGDWSNEILIAHEVAHYWYDRLCIALNYRGGTEAFAGSFENYYEVKMNERR